MGGLDWQALETVSEMFGFADLELLIVQLITIRDWQKENERG